MPLILDVFTNFSQLFLLQIIRYSVFILLARQDTSLVCPQSFQCTRALKGIKEPGDEASKKHQSFYLYMYALIIWRGQMVHLAFTTLYHSRSCGGVARGTTLPFIHLEF